ncbi:hypothetical protein [Lichenicola sp.]|uniref:hypothetical protein n=1 Tax=Lichenicola sp. TaxID=2804529 RepID=UPI003AFF7492
MADITPSVLSNSIMAKFYDVLTNGDATVPKSPDNFLSFVTPGVAVTADDFRFLTQGLSGVVTPAAAQTLLAATNPAPAAGAASSTGTSAASAPAPAPQGLTDAQLSQLRAQDTQGVYQAAEAFARMVDFIPDVASLDGKQLATLAIQTDNGTLSEVYELTLTMSQIMESVIPDDEKAKIDHLRSLLTTTTKTTDLISGAEVDVIGASPMVIAYNTKMTAYDNAALAYNSARINALAGNDPQSVEYFAINAPILRNLVTAAMSDWVTTGYKNQYEEIAAYIAQVEGRDLSLLLAAYKDDLAKAKLTGISSGSDFYYTGATPGDFYQAPGWSTFHFSETDFASYSNNSFSATGWSAHASAGFFGIGASGGASGSKSQAQYSGNFSTKYCRMSFEIMQVALTRAWFKTSFLNSKTWRFDPGNPDVKNNLLSDGGMPPAGLMPAYPTSMIVVRNLMLDFGDNSGFRSFMEQQKSSAQGGSASFSLGPFSLGGGASHSSSSSSSSSSDGYSWTDQGLSVPGMQVVGYRCHVLPKSPNPSPDIKTWI